ncbi:hypothetical protein KPH14_008808 [Odynerus spinipes]|uniref:Serine-enriched protein n=1 Tax=Odynerus spinipes TaxID=1348599 RepID=A0AAD9VHS0_9HYME|nr:hypothetical protein KPH14_008808 [Odynerus spinipes]
MGRDSVEEHEHGGVCVNRETKASWVKVFLRGKSSPASERAPGSEQQESIGPMPEASGSRVLDESDYSTFENKTGLAEDMKFLASMPELCDVTFLVGDTREPVCAVKAVLAARSRVFHKMLYQAPSPQRKKEAPTRENKIRLFLKRSSEPLLNLQNAAQQPQSNQHHTLIIEEFEPDVFRQLIEYIHTGCVTLQPRTLLGVMNAADYYGLDELRKACAGFVQCCITVDTVCALLASAERYIQYKCTKSLVQKVLEFVDEHGNEVLNLGSFTLLPQHVVRLILAREELRADEFTKFQAALMWSKKYYDSNQNTPLKDIIGNFLEYIQFHKIPTNALVNEVHPLGLVPDGIIMNALAYQADPTSVEPGKLSPHRVRKQGRSMSVQSSLDPYAAVSDEPRREDALSNGENGRGLYEQPRNGELALNEAAAIQELQRKEQQREEEQRKQQQLQEEEQWRKQQQQQQEEEQRRRQQQEEEQRRRQQQEEEEERLKQHQQQLHQKREEEEQKRIQQQQHQLYLQHQWEEGERKQQQQLQRQKRKKEEEERWLRMKEEEEEKRQQQLEEQRRQVQEYQQQPQQEQQQEQQQSQRQQREQTQEQELRQQDQEQQQQQQGVHPVDGLGGLYIRLVLRREGRANLVWLYKTHKF